MRRLGTNRFPRPKHKPAFHHQLDHGLEKLLLAVVNIGGFETSGDLATECETILTRKGYPLSH
ncbi:MAG: hypothetical protein QUS13_01140 [Smithella sp.]|nr:hypothetical protein [Smithella sp.]